MTLFFVGCIVVFYLLGRAGVPIGVPFFLWIGIFSVSLVAQFWSFANDLYLPAQGKRLFAIVQFGGSAGAVIGATLVGRLIAPIGIYASLARGGRGAAAEPRRHESRRPPGGAAARDGRWLPALRPRRWPRVGPTGSSSAIATCSRSPAWCSCSTG